MRLRSAAMRGLNLQAPGANPLIQLSLTGHPVSDPEFYVLQSSFRDAKFLAGKELMGPLLTSAVSATRKQPGPASLLLARANSIGLAWDGEHSAFVDGHGLLDIWTVTWPEVLHRLSTSWQRAVLHRVSHRPTFEGMQDADPHLTKLAVLSFPKSSRALLRVAQNGTFFTNDALTHVGQVEDSSCVFCGCRDSIHHRILDCRHFQDCRQPCQLTIAELSSLPHSLLLHGWARSIPALTELHSALACTPFRLEDFHPFPIMESYHVFVDGSCCWRPDTLPLFLQ